MKKHKSTHFVAFLYRGHTISHGKFLGKNMAVQEMEWMCLKTHGMYLWVLPLDGHMCTGVHMHFMQQHHYIGDTVAEVFHVRWHR